jgi:hypothetical protein
VAGLKAVTTLEPTKAVSECHAAAGFIHVVSIPHIAENAERTSA